MLLTPSCTDALEICALLLDLGPDDEVILPSFTFVSTANAFALRGAKPIFVDIEPKYFNIDADAIEKAITPRTKAIVVVHYAGVACDIERISKIAADHGIPLIEDAAHALGSSLNGRRLGTFGALSTFSFHETKNVTCGEGGALVINDPRYTDRAYILRDKGTNRRNFQRGSVQFYSWVDLGSSFVISDVLAAFLFAQLEHLEKITAKRRADHRRYSEMLDPLRTRGLLAYSDSPNREQESAHLFAILLSDRATRDRLQAHLRKYEVVAVSHYEPLHRSAYATEHLGITTSLPVTEDIAPRLLRLPMFHELEASQQDLVVKLIFSFFQQTQK